MPTDFTPVQVGEILEPDHVNRYASPINTLEGWREGSAASLADQDLGGHRLKNLAAGTSALPGLSLQNDPDTGIFSPATDALAVVSAGAERARFDAGGLTVTGFKMAAGAASGLVLTSDATGVGTWQASASGTALNSVCDGRLSAVGSEPVSSTEVTAGSNLYYTPYVGNQVALFDGSAWVVRTFPEITRGITGLAASTVYDVFAYWTGSAVDLEFVAWSNATTRATPLATEAGVQVKSGAATRRYLGTLCTVSSGGTRIADSLRQRLVWNAYHRVARPVRVLETDGSWTYSTPSWRYVAGDSTNRVEVVAGLSGHSVLQLSVRHYVIYGAGPGYTGIGRDSGTSVLSECLGKGSYSNQMYAFHAEAVTPGFHYFAWLERGNGNANTFYGSGADATLTQSGMVGLFHC